MIKFLIILTLMYSTICFADPEYEGYKLEKPLLSRLPKKFSRTKDTLTIFLGNKKKKIFKDNNNESTGSFLLSIVEDYNDKQDVAIVEQRFYEGGQFIVISLKDGSEIHTPTKPVWSPDKDKFISTNDDESEYTDNKTVIGVCKLKKCSKVFSEDTHAGEPKWLDDKSVEFEKRSFNAASGIADAKPFTCKVDKKAACLPKK